ncbi:ATP-dependent metalloprotease [Enterococcus phage 47]|nr:ATP-dependent metalloprotease [Enterococcus phage 47]
MPKKYYLKAISMYLLYAFIAAVVIGGTFLLVNAFVWVGTFIYGRFGDTVGTILLLSTAGLIALCTALYYEARKEFRKDALRVRIQDPEDGIDTQSHEIVYMLPEDVIRQASTIVGIIPEDIQHIESEELRKKVLHAIMKHSPVDYGFTLTTTYDPDLDLLLHEIWDLDYTFKTRSKLLSRLRDCGVDLNGEFLKYLVD